MTYIVLAVLREARPLAYFALAFVLFVLSQLDFFLLNKVICKVCLRCAPARWMRVLMRMRAGRQPQGGWRVRRDDPGDGERRRALLRVAKHH
jgi:hypothetical protein